MNESYRPPPAAAASGRAVQPERDREGARRTWPQHRRVLGRPRRAPPEQLDPAGQLPLTVDVTERPRHVVDVRRGLLHRSRRHRRRRPGRTATCSATPSSSTSARGDPARRQRRHRARLQRDRRVHSSRTSWRAIRTLICNLRAIKQSLEAYDRTARDSAASRCAASSAEHLDGQRRAARRAGAHHAGRRDPRLHADAACRLSRNTTTPAWRACSTRPTASRPRPP